MATLYRLSQLSFFGRLDALADAGPNPVPSAVCVLVMTNCSMLCNVGLKTNKKNLNLTSKQNKNPRKRDKKWIHRGKFSIFRISRLFTIWQAFTVDGMLIFDWIALNNIELVDLQAVEAESGYKACVSEANDRHVQLLRVKSHVLQQVRELMLQCDQTMKAVTVSYFQLQHTVVAPPPVQVFRALGSSDSPDGTVLTMNCCSCRRCATAAASTNRVRSTWSSWGGCLCPANPFGGTARRRVPASRVTRVPTRSNLTRKSRRLPRCRRRTRKPTGLCARTTVTVGMRSRVWLRRQLTAVG